MNGEREVRDLPNGDLYLGAYTTRDPWTREVVEVPAVTVPAAERRMAASESCACGYDLCGVCGARPGPHLRMETPGAGREESPAAREARVARVDAQARYETGDYL